MYISINPVQLGQHSMDKERDFFLTQPVYLVSFPTALFLNVVLPHLNVVTLTVSFFTSFPPPPGIL